MFKKTKLTRLSGESRTPFEYEAEISEAGRIRIWESYNRATEGSYHLTEHETRRLFEVLRDAQGSSLCIDKGPTPAGSEGVQAEAKRSPKGCLDAEGTAGHPTAFVSALDVFDHTNRWLPGVCRPLHETGCKEARWEASCV
jgi:hypothetical protein